MLLDRKRIRKWAKWIALGLAIVFALSFLFLGIGYGGAGFNLSEIFEGGCTESSVDETATTPDKLQTLLDSLAADPSNTDLMLEIADYYKSLFNASQGTSTENADSSATYMKQALETDPSLKDVYLDLGKLYIDMGSYSEAAQILNEATSVDPDNPDVYFYLGRAQRAAGRTGEAILAWQKYLELAPDGKLASTVRTELDKMMAPSTTTTAAPTTTTVSGTTSTSSATTTTK